MPGRLIMPDLSDPKLPVALLVTLMLHLAGAAWWVSAKDRDALFLEHRVTTLETGLASTTVNQSAVLERLARIEERLNAEADLLARIDKQLTQLHR